MDFTDSPFERMMRQVPRAYRPEISKAPPDSPCCGCSYWQGVACVGICYKDLTQPRKEAGTSDLWKKQTAN